MNFQMSVQPGMGMNPQMQLQSYYQQACRDGMLTTTEVMTAMNMLGVPIDSATAQQLLMQISLGGCANQASFVAVLSNYYNQRTGGGMGCGMGAVPTMGGMTMPMQGMGMSMPQQPMMQPMMGQPMMMQPQPMLVQPAMVRPRCWRCGGTGIKPKNPLKPLKALLGVHKPCKVCRGTGYM